MTVEEEKTASVSSLPLVLSAVGLKRRKTGEKRCMEAPVPTTPLIRSDEKDLRNENTTNFSPYFLVPEVNKHGDFHFRRFEYGLSEGPEVGGGRGTSCSRNWDAGSRLPWRL